MKGDHGTYPRHHFKTSIIEPPRLNFEASFRENCDDGSYMFVSPRGNVVGQSFYVLDLEYVLRWAMRPLRWSWANCVCAIAAT